MGASHEELDHDLVLVRDVSFATLKAESELVEALVDESSQTFELNFTSYSARAFVSRDEKRRWSGVADGDLEFAPSSPDMKSFVKSSRTRFSDNRVTSKCEAVALGDPRGVEGDLLDV